MGSGSALGTLFCLNFSNSKRNSEAGMHLVDGGFWECYTVRVAELYIISRQTETLYEETAMRRLSAIVASSDA